MSLWQLVGISAVGTAASGNLTLTLPASLQANDLLVACITWRDSPTFSLPSTGGWQNCGASPTAANTTNNATGSISGTRMDYLVRGGSDPSGTDLVWTRTAGNQARGYILAYRRTDGGIPVFEQASAVALAAASANYSATGLTTTEENELLVMACGGARTSGTTNQISAQACATAPTSGSWSEHADSGTTTSATCALAVASAIKPTAGATGNFQFTGVASARHSGVLGRFRAKYNIAPATGSYTVTGQAITEPGVSRSMTSALLSSVDSGDQRNFIVEDVPAGAEASDRYLVAWLYGALQETAPPDTVQITEVTIGGVVATPIIYSPQAITGGAYHLSAWGALVPTGTTVDVNIETDPDGSDPSVASLTAMYRLQGAGSSPSFPDADATLDTSGDGTVSLNIDAPRFGIILAATFGDAYATNATTVWTNVTEDYDTPIGGFQVVSTASAWFADDVAAVAVTTNDDGTPALSNFKLFSAFSVAPGGAGASLIAGTGNFSLTGQTANFLRQYIVPFTHGSFTLSGQNVSLFHGLFGTAEHGSFTYTGQDVSFIIPRIFADPGIYELLGQDVDMIQGQIFFVDFGTFTLFGYDVSLEYHQHGQWFEENEETDAWTEQDEITISWTPQAGLLNTWTEES